MSSAEKAARLLLKLEPEEWRVLQAVERGMANYSIVPMTQLLKYTKMPDRDVEFSLRALNKKDLIWRSFDPYHGYILNYSGYDLLALNALAKMNILNSLGRQIGVGKESDILDAITDKGKRVALKFHRLGRTSFRETRRRRGYIKRRGYTSWHYQSRLAAKKEFSVQTRVHNGRVSTPHPIHQNRHVIVMEFIDGYNLNDVSRLDDPSSFLEDILENVRATFRIGLIHADLSEYNIMVQKDSRVLLIDWPQAIEVDHPNAENILERDIRNVLRFFQRRFKVHRCFKKILDFIKN
ncbi:MAG: RIO1 family regulatory kinase/ATPase [Candidatus Bathyarchaeota archaeon]|jgi:RIO kinase 2|nr:RIO1 family regulatory kinase/ATPase [Candidatus Bathyarchaeota archaeon]